MEDTSIHIPADVKLAFSRCDIYEEPYDEYETKIRNATSEYSDEDLQRQEPLLLICDSCRQRLDILPTFNPYASIELALKSKFNS